MAGGGIISSTMTAAEVVTAALQELGVLSAGEQPDGEELVLGLRSLNFMFKGWSTRGLTSWRNEEGAVIAAAGAREVALDPYCNGVAEVRAVQAANYERPLQRWELAQYRQIPNKAAIGTPTAYAVSKTADAVALLVWPVPVSDTTLLYTYSRVIEDVTDGAQTLDVPQEWLEAVYVALAARLAQAFGVTRIDPATTQIIIQRALSLENELFAADQPASFYMGSAYGRYF